MKIDTPVMRNLSVAATTSLPHLHVIGTEYSFMIPLQVILTLGPSQPKCEFDPIHYPPLPLRMGIDFHYTVSLCIGSCLFIVIGFRMGEFEVK